jgi:hypothetical protein
LVAEPVTRWPAAPRPGQTSRKRIVSRGWIESPGGAAAKVEDRCVNLRAGYALADVPAIEPARFRRQAGTVKTNQPFQEHHMKKLLAALIAGLFAVAGAAVAADAKKEEKKAEAKKDAKAEPKKEEKKDAKK